MTPTLALASFGAFAEHFACRLSWLGTAGTSTPLGQARPGTRTSSYHMRSAILWEWSPDEAWRWGQTILEFLVEQATLQAMERLGDWDLEDSSYHLAQLTCLLRILCLTEG